MTIAVMAGGAEAASFYRKHGFTRFNEINVTTSYDEHGNTAETKYVWPLLERKPQQIEPAELEVSSTPKKATCNIANPLPVQC